MNKILLFALCFLLAITARSQKENSDIVLPKTALLKLKITKLGDDYIILVKDLTLVNNNKKNYLTTPDNDNKDGLVCFMLDKSQAIIDSLKIKEPMVTRYEYPNEDGTIGSKEIEADEKEVILRFPYNPRMQYIHILKITSKKQKKPLATLKLPNPGN